MEKSKRTFFDEITILKGIAILLVILGHAITQTEQQGRILSTVKQVIYSFHMPLFFFASGFLSLRLLDARDWRSRISYGGNRTLRLLIPYFFMGALYMFAGVYYYKNPQIIGKETIIGMVKGTNPDSELWFLYVLWLITLASLVLIRKVTLWFWTVISGILSLISYLFVDYSVILQMVLYFAFYVILGMAFRTCYEKVRPCLLKWYLWTHALVVFGIGNLIQILHPLSGTVGGVVSLVTAFAGILLFLATSVGIADGGAEKNFFRRGLTFCGDYAMDLYIIAEPIKVLVRIVFWEHLHWNYLLCTALCFVIPVVTTLVISRYVVRRSRVLSLLFLGKLS